MQKRLFVIAVILVLGSVSNLPAAQLLFTPTIILSEEYTDNLFLDYQNEEDSLITSAGVDLTAQMNWRTAGIELSYRPTYNTIKKYSDLDYWRHLASLDIWKDLTRSTRVELTDTYLRTSDPTDQSPVIEQDGQPQAPVIATDINRRGRNEYYTNVAEARLAHHFGTNQEIYAGYRYSILRDVDNTPGTLLDDNNIATPLIGLTYDYSPTWRIEFDNFYEIADYKDRNDRNEYNGNIRLLYRFSRANSCFVNYRHTILNYDQEGNEDYQVYEPSIGLRVDFRDNARIQIGAGYYIQDFETSEREEGFDITSDIYKRWTFQSSFFTISGSSGYIIDDNGVQDNGLNIYYQGRVEEGYNFSPWLQGSIFGGYRRDDYLNETPDPSNKVTTAGLTLEWQALQWMTLAFTYDFRDLSSAIQTYEYTENRAMLTIRMAPSTPWRMEI